MSRVNFDFKTLIGLQKTLKNFKKNLIHFVEDFC